MTHRAPGARLLHLAGRIALDAVNGSAFRREIYPVKKFPARGRPRKPFYVCLRLGSFLDVQTVTNQYLARYWFTVATVK
jgi:hypothetical protein